MNFETLKWIAPVVEPLYYIKDWASDEYFIEIKDGRPIMGKFKKARHFDSLETIKETITSLKQPHNNLKYYEVVKVELIKL